MHRIANREIKSLTGRALQIPMRDSVGDFVWKDEATKTPKLEDANVERVLLMVVTQIPPQFLTHQDSIHGTRLWGQIHASLADSAEILNIEDAEWDWVFKQLTDDRVGPKIFGMNCYPVERQLRDLDVPPAESKAAQDDRPEETTTTPKTRKK